MRMPSGMSRVETHPAMVPSGAAMFLMAKRILRLPYSFMTATVCVMMPSPVPLRCDMERASKRISEEAAAREVGTLVLGLPKNMDGSEGVRAEKSREFKAMLERDSGLPVVLWDERRSSI